LIPLGQIPDKRGSGTVFFQPTPKRFIYKEGKMAFIQLIPAYGRDYKSQREVQEAWDANKDFWTADIVHGYGTATNKQDCDAMGLRVIIRYASKQKVYAVK
jgi:hypothetical protein